MRDHSAIPKALSSPPRRTIPIRPSITYDEFQSRAWIASQEIAGCGPRGRGAILIPQLRRKLEAVPRTVFDQCVLRMERNGLVYLVPPCSLDGLSDADLEGSLHGPGGDVRSFLIWLPPKPRTTYSWD